MTPYENNYTKAGHAAAVKVTNTRQPNQAIPMVKGKDKKAAKGKKKRGMQQASRQGAQIMLGGALAKKPAWKN